MMSLWLTLPLVLALPAHNVHERHADGSRLPSGIPPLVEKAASHPAEMLDCLRRHQYTPLVCTMQNHTEFAAAAPRSPPPPAAECGAGSEASSPCFYGRGRCTYDAVRGWYCACAGGHPVARGVHRDKPDLALAPHCIPE